MGFVTALLMQFIQVRALGGGLDALLSVGETSETRTVIEADLGDLTLVPGNGHDGQSSYIVARDPLGRGDGASTLDHAGFRYRRILYSALGGMFGLLPGWATVAGLALVASMGMGLAAAMTADIGIAFGATDRVALAVVVNPGMWLSVQLLTADALAVGLALTGLALWIRHITGPAIIALSLAVLAKDQVLLVALAIAGYELWRSRPRLAFRVAVGPVATLVWWSAVVTMTVGGGFSARGNLAWPFQGMWRSAGIWPTTPVDDMVRLGIMIVVLAVGAWAGWRARRTAVGWVLLGWVGLAVVSSHWVWELGNNVARVFAIVIPLAVVAIMAGPAPDQESPGLPA